MAYRVRKYFVMQDRDEEHGQYQQKSGRDFSITKFKLKTMESSDLCYPLSNSLKLGGLRGLVTHVYCRFTGFQYLFSSVHIF